MKVKRNWIAKGLCILSYIPTLAGAGETEFHGYLRSGLGFSRGGTDQQCFSASGVKFRLGNECDTYGELSFVQNYEGGKTALSPQYKSVITLSLSSAGERDYEATSVEVSKDLSTNTSLNVALREAFVTADQVLPFSGSLWAGKRYYQRRDVHMLDLYYLSNSGPGFGIENMSVGMHRLSLALTRNLAATQKGEDDQPAQTNIDLRLADLPAPLGGKLEFVLISGFVGSRGARSGEKRWEDLSGSQLSLIHTQPYSQGNNTLVAQYGYGLFGADASSRSSTLSSFGGWGSQGIAKGNEDLKKARMSSSTLRVLNDYVAKVLPELSLGLVALYQNINFGSEVAGTKSSGITEITAGARPIWHINQSWDLALEAGYSKINNALVSRDITNTTTNYKDSQLTKLTVAPQVSLGEFYFGRPNLRFFATYATWNEDSKGQVGSQVYANDNAGFSTGAQFETWW